MESTLAVVPPSIPVDSDAHRPALSPRAQRALRALAMLLGWIALFSVITSLVHQRASTTPSVYEQCVRQ